MKKLTTKLLISVLSIALALITLGTQTFAWFTMNRTVSASGMKVQAVAEGSIIIVKKGTLPTDGVKTTNVNFSDVATTELYASTHSVDYTNHTTGLKTVSNPSVVNLETGLKRKNTTLTYAEAENGAKTYYVDYVVYIAGDGEAFDGQDIDVTLSGSYATPANTINNAISVDFYGDTVSENNGAPAVSSANYQGTLNVAGRKNNNDNYTYAAYTTFEIDNIDIPKTGSGSVYAILMRVYFDGALIETSANSATEDSAEFKAAVGTDGKCTAGTYYYTGDSEVPATIGAEVATVTAGSTPVDGLYELDTTKSSLAYARNVEAAKLQEVTLQATFTTRDHS